MSEIILKIGPGSNYEDGDIVCAFNNRRIRGIHAEQICHIKTIGLNADGLRQINSLPELFQKEVYQYRFERVSKTEVKRINQITLEEEIISNIPNAKREHIYLDEFLTRRKKNPNHRIFGTAGNEVWYGGITDVSNIRLDNIWQKIEERTEHREVNHKDWPCSDQELRHFFVVPTDDFDDAQADELVSSIESKPDERGHKTIIKKRKSKVNFRTGLGLSEDTLGKIDDMKIKVPKPSSISHELGNIVIAKVIQWQL
jgi:hypothetical protein